MLRFPGIRIPGHLAVAPAGQSELRHADIKGQMVSPPYFTY
ncbi:MAG: hypothetical protein AB7H80_15395 [Candidatus Kapaibacterium sp.]